MPFRKKLAVDIKRSDAGISAPSITIGPREKTTHQKAVFSHCRADLTSHEDQPYEIEWPAISLQSILFADSGVR
jgi:hypothetical protein